MTARPTFTPSVEADVFPRKWPERAIVIDGAIGEGSPPVGAARRAAVEDGLRARLRG